ncbi:MAG: hypothetical protein G01um101429_794 [Parcubacteria group bacterium Gr01-1014_29]|nr:MAG: hypothetical protein G01um101429_794 [Parcubacteria group bacterium Gr01-1014_29]
MSYKGTQQDLVLQERAARAAAALYRVTDLFIDNEPLKWKLRRDALNVIETVEKKSSLASGNYLILLQELQNAKKHICSLRVKLAIAQAGGYILRINFQVLEQEYKDIEDILTGEIAGVSNKADKNLLDIYIGHDVFVKDIQNLTDMSNRKSNIVEQSIGGSSEASLYGKKNMNEPSSINERQEAIKNTLQKKSWIGLTDLVSLYSAGVGSKTIQRDLQILMQMGIVQSKGERRWRRYALVDSHNFIS